MSGELRKPMQAVSDIRHVWKAFQGEALTERGQAASIDSRFCHLTDSANRALAVQDFVLAEQRYREALLEADNVFLRAMDADRAAIMLAPMVHNVGCHNLAEQRRQAEDDAEAFDLAVRAIERIVVAADSPQTPLALRVNCVRHFKYPLVFLAERVAESGLDETVVARYVERARSATSEVMRIASYSLAPESMKCSRPC